MKRRITNEELQAEARRRGVSVVIRQHPRKRGWGEAVFLPGLLRRRHAGEEFDEFAPERDDDGSGLVE